MTQAEIAGTITIAVYMGTHRLLNAERHILEEVEPPHYAGYVESICPKWYKSLDALAPVVKKVKDELASFCTSTGVIAGWSDHFLNINNACMDLEADKVFIATAAAINFINDKRKEQSGHAVESK